MAYKETCPCIPAFNSQLMSLLKGLSVGQEAENILTAWHQGYTDSPLAE